MNLSARDLEMSQMALRAKAPMGDYLTARIGQSISPELQQQLIASVGASAGCGPVTGQGCAPMNYPAQVVQSVLAKQCNDPQYPLPSGVTPEIANFVTALVNTSKYASSPARLGWQCDSLTFLVPATAALTNFGPVNQTPTRSFVADSMVAASGTSSDIAFQITSLTYDGENYVDNSPWISTFFTADSPCCLCVRSLKIIAQNTTVSLSGTTVAQVAAANVGAVGVMLFGQTLFSGNP